MRRAKSGRSRIISYTYTEPVVFLEYLIDSTRLARKAGLRNCMITGGAIEPKPLTEALAVLDAVKVEELDGELDGRRNGSLGSDRFARQLA